VNDVGVKLDSRGVVPLGFDWNCIGKKKKCKEVFSSFNKAKSQDITKELV